MKVRRRIRGGGSKNDLMRSESVAYRGAHAEDMIGVEFVVVRNEIVVAFGPDEECSPEVVANSDSEV